MSIELREVTQEERNILENMVHFYLDDLSKYTNQLKTNNQGIFEYERLDLFFTKSNLFPFFIIYKGEVVGFLFFVKTVKNREIDYCVNDIFIFRQYRERGFAGQAVKTLFSSYPGRYYVVQLEKNQESIHFWKSLYKDFQINFIEEQIIDSGEKCWAQSFTIR